MRKSLQIVSAAWYAVSTALGCLQCAPNAGYALTSAPDFVESSLPPPERKPRSISRADFNLLAAAGTAAGAAAQPTPAQPAAAQTDARAAVKKRRSTKAARAKKTAKAPPAQKTPAAGQSAGTEQNIPQKHAPLVRADIAWRLSWNPDKDLINRADIKLHAPAGVIVRAQFFDKRQTPPWEDSAKTVQDFGFGLYHHGLNSRLLFGAVHTWGLANRTRGVWNRALPFTENHAISGADLKTTVSLEPKHSLFFRLGTPDAWPLNLYAAAVLDHKQQPDFTAGAGFSFSQKTKLRAEASYKEQTLPERTMSTWFSEKAALPQRDFRFYAASLVFTNPYISFSGDIAHSQAFAWGEGLYANAALRFGSKPWRLEVAAEGADGRYLGNDGTACGAGFRSGALFELAGKRSALLRARSEVVAARLGAPFSRSTSKLYARLPVIGGGGFNLSYISLAFERDGDARTDIQDGFDLGAGFRAGPFRPSVKYSYVGRTSAEAGSPIIPYPDFWSPHDFVSSAVSFDTAFTYSILHVKAQFVYEESAQNKAVWKSVYSGGLNWKWGGVSAKLSERESGGFDCSVSANARFVF
ncbi:MAG: hypothetical protein LBC72_03565 [Spirochaetaceae bacterium]|jgi:hypothetical protein|nr:hypothetical protein [Spirochaetaceae bacterium]